MLRRGTGVCWGRVTPSGSAGVALVLSLPNIGERLRSALGAQEVDQTEQPWPAQVAGVVRASARKWALGSRDRPSTCASGSELGVANHGLHKLGEMGSRSSKPARAPNIELEKLDPRPRASLERPLLLTSWRPNRTWALALRANANMSQISHELARTGWTDYPVLLAPCDLLQAFEVTTMDHG